MIDINLLLEDLPDNLVITPLLDGGWNIRRNRTDLVWKWQVAITPEMTDEQAHDLIWDAHENAVLAAKRRELREIRVEQQRVVDDAFHQSFQLEASHALARKQAKRKAFKDKKGNSNVQ